MKVPAGTDWTVVMVVSGSTTPAGTAQVEAAAVAQVSAVVVSSTAVNGNKSLFIDISSVALLGADGEDTDGRPFLSRFMFSRYIGEIHFPPVLDTH